MNRRDALKKLGVGSAVVVGATAVTSLPAFAVSSPTITDSLDVSLVGNVGITASLTLGSATCSGSAIPPCDVCDPSRAEVIDVSMTAFLVNVTTAGTRYGWGSTAAAAIANEIFSGGPGTTVTATLASPYEDPYDNGFLFARNLRHVRANGRDQINPEIGDELQISGYVAYQCSYGDGTASVAETIDFSFTYNGAGWTKVILG